MAGLAAAGSARAMGAIVRGFDTRFVKIRHLEVAAFQTLLFNKDVRRQSSCFHPGGSLRARRVVSHTAETLQMFRTAGTS